jgi:hypothetical protein
MGTGDCDWGVIAAVIAGHGGSGNCREGHGVVGMVSRIESLVPAGNLNKVMVLAADVERLEELVDYNHSLSGPAREHERIGVVGHVSEPRRGA